MTNDDSSNNNSVLINTLIAKLVNKIGDLKSGAHITARWQPINLRTSIIAHLTCPSQPLYI